MNKLRRCLAFSFLLLLLGAGLAWAEITGSISGLVTDPSGAAIAAASITATNTQTGITSTVASDAKGFYSFPVLPIGVYDVEVSRPGFKTYRKSGLVIDANSALRVDVALQVGSVSEKIVVKSDAVHVETESTQMGEVITGTKMVAVPLNGRDFTDLLALQPGVVPGGYAAQSPGLNDRAVSGSDHVNAGNQSINGQREAANGFMVNGSSVEEGKNNGTAIIPNLDSIAEFRIITNNFDAEYGKFSGGQVNIATKSGTNEFHGTAFDFLRNTVLDAKNFFASPSDATPVYIQNQFGGTGGGPIKRDKLFFFGDYQGTRQIQAPTRSLLVPTLADRTGDLSGDLAASMTGTVSSAFWANTLAQRLGYAVAAGEPYYMTGCTSSSQCVFPNGVIPQNAWAPPSAKLLAYIPTPNVTGGSGFNYTTSAFARRLNDDKGGIRADLNSRYGMLSGYYFLDDYTADNPYPNGGANMPGFNALDAGRSQLVTLSDTKPVGATAVNELRISFMRSAFALFQPKGGLGTTLSSLGFVSGFSAATGGIGPVNPALEGVPSVSLTNMGISMGLPTTTTRQFDNTWQFLDNFSKVIGTHSLRFGGQFHYSQINERNFFGENGAFAFGSSETGNDFANFLIGAPDNIQQASPQILDSRSKYAGLFFQDSWRAAPSLTVNYGLRWEVSQPWYDTQNKIETLVPGEQSVVFPNAPLGWVVPGDPGIPQTLAPTKWNAFSPRLGVAYSPSASTGLLGKLLGGPGKTSIRAGFGTYFTAYEDLSQFLEVGDAPYGLFWFGGSPVFEAPYTDRSDGTKHQRFPVALPPPNVSASNPYSGFNWSLVEPISFGYTFYHKNRLPYSEHYEFSLQRELGAETVVSVSYVGNQAHKLITSMDANPGNPALCLSLPGCGPFGEDSSYTATSGQTIPTTRPLGPAFSSNPWMIATANSSYNSLQASLRHSGRGTTFLIGYTYSKCLDNGSGLQDSTNPFNPSLSRSLCLFDVTHNFVASSTADLPFDKLTHSTGWTRKVTGGWSLSGIATLATGLPVNISENDDRSLTGTFTAPIDQPNYTPGQLLLNTNPRSRQPYFNASLFSLEGLGQVGTSRRRFFHGPGLNNFNLALLKNTQLTESTQLQFRLEAFNAFNHAQFGMPNGNFNSSTFGEVGTARDPRIMQVAMKFLF
jgi:hypothetical protein